MPVGNIVVNPTPKNTPREHVFGALEVSGFFNHNGVLYVKIDKHHAHQIQSMEPPKEFNRDEPISGVCVDVHCVDNLT